MTYMLFGGKYVNILAYRTQHNTPAGTVWRFITDKAKTIVVVPYSFDGKPCGEAHSIPNQIGAIAAFTTLGLALLRLAVTEIEDLDNMLNEYAERLDLKELLLIRNEVIKEGVICRRKEVMLGDKALLKLLASLQQNSKRDIYSILWRQLPPRARNQIITSMKAAKTGAPSVKNLFRYDMFSDTPFLARFQVGDSYALVEAVSTVPPDSVDIDIIKTSPIPKLLPVPMQHRDASSTQGHNPVDGVMKYKPQQVYKILNIVRHQLDKLVQNGELVPCVNTTDRALKNGRNPMRYFWADEVHKYLEKIRSSTPNKKVANQLPKGLKTDRT